MPRTHQTIYLDYNASAPLREVVREHFVDVLGETGNASSVHAAGRKARGRIEASREAVAALCGSRSRGVMFTSGATEANVTALTLNWQNSGAPVYLDRLLRGATEHPSIVAGGRVPPSAQTVIPVDANGVIDLLWLKDALEEGGLSLVSVMAANNETGVVQPVEEIGALVKAAGGIFHVDAVQATGRTPIDIEEWQADAISLSAHKLGGPLGVGALVFRTTACVPAPLLTGGGQENWKRAGTENVAAISAFGVAAKEAAAGLETVCQWATLRQGMETAIRQTCPGTVIFGGGVQRIPNTSCFAVRGVPAETALIAFDLEGICLSSGSACSSGKVSVSHVLTAMGVGEDLARCALRVSIGHGTTEAEIEKFVDVWTSVVDRLNPAAREIAA